MGVVYQARQVQLNRLVALKMILAGGHASAADLARFRTEAEAIARLQHPNIVQVFEVGEHEGKPYFSLEFCAGGSLAGKLDGTPLPPMEAARLVETLARAMEATHQKGIIHRDLKPANVLLLEDGTPKITDFGLAKKLNEAGQTASGAVLGTPSYMAPEQAGGKGKAVGAAADVYALGAILYELLTGRPPFRAPSALDTLLQVVTDDPVPPRQLQSKTPKDLETICLKCLQKEPLKRYGSALELAEDLRRSQVGVPIQARPVGPIERAVKWGRRKPALAALIVAGLLALVSGIYFTLDLQRRKTEMEQQLLRLETARYALQVNLAYREIQELNFTRAADVLDTCRQDLRHWEHRYLSYLLQKNVRKFPTSVKGRSEPNSPSLVFSPDSRSVAVLGNMVQILDVTSGKECLRVSPGPCSAGSFSSDGKQFLTVNRGANTHNISIWEIATGKKQFAFTCALAASATSSGPGGTVAFTPDGKRLVCLFDQIPRTPRGRGRPGKLKVFEVATGQEIVTLNAFSNPVDAFAFSPDGKRVVTLTNSGNRFLGPVPPSEAKVWDADTGQQVHSFKVDDAECLVTWSPNGKRLCTGGGSVFRLWDFSTGKELFLFQTSGTCAHLAYSSDAQCIAGAFVDGTVRSWNLSTGKESIVDKGTAQLAGVAFSPDNKFLASYRTGEHRAGSFEARARTMPVDLLPEGEIKIWNVSANALVRTHKIKGKSIIIGSHFSHDTKRLHFVDDNVHKIWDVMTGQVVFTLPKEERGRECLLGPSGAFVAETIFDNVKEVNGRPEYSSRTVKIREIATGREIIALKEDASKDVRALAFSPDEKRLAIARGLAGSKRTEVNIWSIRTGREMFSLKGHTSEVTALAFSLDGKRLATGSSNSVKIWDAVSGRFMRGAPSHHLWTLKFSPDGKRLVSATYTNEITVWDVQTGSIAFTLREDKQRTGGPCVCFSPDGCRLAGSWGDQLVRIWDTSTGQELLSLTGHSSSVRAVAFSPDGTKLVSASSDGMVKIWTATAPGP
jgi:WD40 repeat protein